MTLVERAPYYEYKIRLSRLHTFQRNRWELNPDNPTKVLFRLSYGSDTLCTRVPHTTSLAMAHRIAYQFT